MISKKLKTIFLISIPLFIGHGLEEYIMEFYKIDSHVKFVFGYFDSLPSLQAVFLLFQIMFWILLIVYYLLISDEKNQLRLLVIPGLAFVYELHHFYKAIEVGGYYPGLITAFLFPLVGFLFWREFLNNFKEV